MLRITKAFWLALPALVATACPMYPSSCDEETDCALGYTCDSNGSCVAVPPAPPPDNPDAPARCGDMSCPEGLVCDRYKRCVPPTGDAGASGNAGASAGGAP